MVIRFAGVRWHLPSDESGAGVTVAALRGFQLENKDLPKKLDAVTEKYVSKLPTDPYSTGAQPLELNLQRRVLQSKSGETFKLGF